MFGEGMRVSLTEIIKKDDHFQAGSQEVTPLLGQKWTEYRTVLGFDYGVRPDTTLTLLAPYVSREWQRETLPTHAHHVITSST